MAPARKLIVKVDGGYHGDVRRQRVDARRDKRLARAGIACCGCRRSWYSATSRRQFASLLQRFQ
jgi:very-short-patch-repair endonuclease